MSRKEFADRTHFSIRTIKSYELNERQPSIHSARVIAKTLNLPQNLQSALIAFSRGSSPAQALLELIQADIAPGSTITPDSAASPFVVPSLVTTLLGRIDVLKRAQRLLQRPNVRLISVVGPPGVGKTRFSIELAHLLREQFDDGVIFVGLASISRAEDMPQVICDVVLPAYGAGQNTDSDALTNLKRVIANKHILLILDNFEHLLSDASAQIVNDLLTATPNLEIIITSREAINIYGQYRLRLEPLDIPTIDFAHPTGPTNLLSYAAIALFEERAQATLPNFELTEANAQKVIQLCVMLDGLPLAIEIAATNLDRFTVSGLLNQLESHQWDLHSHQRGVAQRHQSLHNLISHSYSLLRPEEQQVFSALSVFADNANEEGVAMVMGLPQNHASQLLDHLYALAAKSLIIHEIVEDTARFSMLQTLREYGLDILKANEQEFEHRRRHAQYFLAFAEYANSQMRGEHYLYWMSQLELNHNNCRAALLWCQQHDTELGLELATAWADFWFQQGHASEGYEWLSRLLGLMNGKDIIDDLASHPLTTLIQCHAMCALTKFTMIAGSMPVLDVIALLESQCLPLFRQHNDLYGEALVKMNMGDAHYCVSENSRGLAELTDGLAILRNVGQDKDIVIALNFLVLCLLPVDALAAMISAEEGLVRSQKIGNPSLIARSTLTLSMARRWTQDYEGAVLAGQEAVTLYRHIQDKLGLQDALNRLSQALTWLKRYDDSRAVLQEYLEVGQQLGLDHVVQVVWRNLGNIAYLEGNMAEALKQLLMGAESRVQGNSHREAGLCLMIMVPVVARLGHPQAAVQIAEAMLTLFASMDHAVNPQYQQLLNEGLALAHEQLNETSFAAAQAEGRNMSLEEATAKARSITKAIL